MARSRCAVLYARIHKAASEPELVQLEADMSLAISYARKRAIRVLGSFIDSYGSKRTPREELTKAIRLCVDADAFLLMPRLGRMASDPSFYEEVHLAGVELVVLADRDITRDTVLRKGMEALRADTRRGDDGELLSRKA